LSKRQYQNFVILHKEIFEKKKIKSKTVLVPKYVLKIIELNVRIAIPQLVDNKQVYEEILPVLV
jgi:hypothetical protein